MTVPLLPAPMTWFPFWRILSRSILIFPTVAPGQFSHLRLRGNIGYRTAASYADSPTYEQDRQEAAKVAQCLKDHGWELASHSWGHLDLGTVEWDRFKTDTDKWETEVDSLIGPTDIILYPFGADVGDWHPTLQRMSGLPICIRPDSGISATWTPTSTGYSLGTPSCARDDAIWTATVCGRI